MRGNIWYFLLVFILAASLSNVTLSQFAGLLLKPVLSGLSTFTSEVNSLMGGSNDRQPPSELPGE